jgi:uncharacterized lipoprotein YajG
MKLLFSLCLCLLLAACLTAEERMQAARQQNAAQDDEKCQSSGAKPGEAAYEQCRTQLAVARTRSDAAVAAIMATPSTNCVRGNLYDHNCF